MPRSIYLHRYGCDTALPTSHRCVEAVCACELAFYGVTCSEKRLQELTLVIHSLRTPCWQR